MPPPVPRKNVAPSNAVRQFWCEICKKGYPRQPDYENHLRSYDHNHRQRLADMKRLTALNDSDSKKRGPEDLRSVPLDGPGKQPGLGPRFTKVASDAGSSRFKKVGTSAKTGVTEETAIDVHDQGTGQAKRPEESLRVREGVENQPVESVNQESDGEVITWIPYDFRQHTGCDREDCIARLAASSGNLDSDEEWFV